jgi:hypothetical protein
MRIDKYEIWRKYIDQAIVITKAGEEDPLAGMIVHDKSDDYCGFVKNPNLVEYYETRSDLLVEKIYFKDVKDIEYQ